MSSDNSSALNLLSIYNNSDSESDNEIPGPKVSVKRCLKDDDIDTGSNEKIERYITTNPLITLPVPSILLPKNQTENLDNPELHGGRIRSFPHERGNWSTYIYIPYDNNDVMQDLIKDIIKKCESFFILQPVDHLHISLTKTVILRHHWIDSFTKTVSENLASVHGFFILFDKLKVYCNDERTRTFIGLQIKSGQDTLINLVKILDKCLKEFNLPEFYEDPSFHMSLLWCVGDYENMFNNILEELNQIVYEYMNNNPQYYWYINVKNLICKTGNKHFTFNLTQYKNM